MRVHHLPTFISVEPANFCQLRCPECPIGQGKHLSTKPQLMSMQMFERILQQTYATAHTIQFYFQGEPLLNQQLPEMIYKANKLGLYTIVSTNAQALNPNIAEKLVKSGLKHIIVSIDGFTQESYEAYRIGGSLHKALEGLSFLSQAKAQLHSRIRIEIQVLRLRSNEHEWEWIKRNYKKLGATHLVFKTAQLYDYEDGHPLMPSNERYARYKKTATGKYINKWAANKKNKYFTCLRLWQACVINTRGEVLPCCYDKDSQYPYGNIMQHNLKDIFTSHTATTFRLQLLHRQLSPKMCHNCIG